MEQVVHSNEQLLGAFSPPIFGHDKSCAFGGFPPRGTFPENLDGAWALLVLCDTLVAVPLSHPAFRYYGHAFRLLCSIYCPGIWQLVVGCYFGGSVPPRRFFGGHTQECGILI